MRAPFSGRTSSTPSAPRLRALGAFGMPKISPREEASRLAALDSVSAAAPSGWLEGSSSSNTEMGSPLAGAGWLAGGTGGVPARPSSSAQPTRALALQLSATNAPLSAPGPPAVSRGMATRQRPFTKLAEPPAVSSGPRPAPAAGAGFAAALAAAAPGLAGTSCSSSRPEPAVRTLDQPRAWRTRSSLGAASVRPSSHSSSSTVSVSPLASSPTAALSIALPARILALASDRSWQPTNALPSGGGVPGVPAGAGTGAGAARSSLSSRSPFCEVTLSQPRAKRTRRTPPSLVRHSSASTTSPTSTKPVRCERRWSKPSRTAERFTHSNRASAPPERGSFGRRPEPVLPSPPAEKSSSRGRLAMLHGDTSLPIQHLSTATRASASYDEGSEKTRLRAQTPLFTGQCSAVM